MTEIFSWGKFMHRTRQCLAPTRKGCQQGEYGHQRKAGISSHRYADNDSDLELHSSDFADRRP